MEDTDLNTDKSTGTHMGRKIDVEELRGTCLAGKKMEKLV